MRFFAPAGLGLAVIIPIIILLYLLRRRRQELVVPSVLLWQRLLEDMQANAPWQKLRRNLLLILQLVVAAALVLAAARPYVNGFVGGRDVYFVVDVSASMQATDVAPDRLGAAKAAIRAALGRLGPLDRAAMVVMGVSPRVAVAPTRDRGKVEEALAALGAENGEANLAQALDLVASMAKAGGGPARNQVVVVSDGTLAPLSGDAAQAARTALPDLVYLPVGSGAGRNLAIDALATRVVGGRPVALVRVTNYGSEAESFSLQVLVGGQPFDLKKGTTGPGQAWQAYVPLPGDAHLVEARLVPDGRDDLATDNRAAAVVDAGRALKVLLVTGGNVFLEKAISLRPGVDIYRLRPEGDLAPDGYDLYVYDGVVPPAWPKAPALVIGPPAGQLGTGTGTVVPQQPAAADDNDPLLAFVDLSDVAVGQARAVTLPAWARPVIVGGGTTLLYVGNRDGQPTAVFSFDLHASNLPLRPAFPILVQNLLGWLVPTGVGGKTAVRPGEAVTVAPVTGAEEIAVVDPQGHRQKLAPPFPPAVYSHTGMPGIYTVEEKTPTGLAVSHFAVNLFAPRESSLAVAASLDSAFGAGEAGGTSGAGAGSGSGAGLGQAAAPGRLASDRELWPLLGWLALVVLTVEWWVYVRGH